MTETHNTDVATTHAGTEAPTPESVFIPVSRGRAFSRSSVWLAPALVQGLIFWHILADVQLGKSSGGSAVVTSAMIALLVPFALAGVGMTVVGLRWLLLALWPGRIGITADDQSLRLALGPFGSSTNDVDRLEAKYLFELSIDIVEEGFEALLPEKEQVENLLPRLLHPDAKKPIDRTILRFAGGTEAEVAQLMRPVVALWRDEDTTTEDLA